MFGNFLMSFLWLLLCVTFLFLFLAFFLVVFLVFLATFPKLVQLNLPFLIVKSISIPPGSMVPCALTFAYPRSSPLLFAIIIDRSVEVGVKPITVAWAFKVYLPSVKTVSFVSISVLELLTKLILLIEAEPLILVLLIYISFTKKMSYNILFSYSRCSLSSVGNTSFQWKHWSCSE